MSGRKLKSRTIKKVLIARGLTPVIRRRIRRNNQNMVAVMVTEIGGEAMSNKKLGNSFEAEMCEILAEEGFWCHLLSQNAAGQPADIIAVKEGLAYLIDCKVCSRGRFQFSRIEENQEQAMEMWRECGNGEGLFALEFQDDVYMVSLDSMLNCKNHHKSMTAELAAAYGIRLNDWLWCRR